MHSLSLSRGISHSKAQGSPVSELPRAFQSLPPEMGEHGAAGCARLAWGPSGLRGKALQVEGCPEAPPEGHARCGTFRERSPIGAEAPELGLPSCCSLHTGQQVCAEVNAVTDLLLGGAAVPVLSCLQLGVSVSFLFHWGTI